MPFDYELFNNLLILIIKGIIIISWFIIGLFCAYYSLSDDRISKLGRWVGSILLVFWVVTTLSIISGKIKEDNKNSRNKISVKNDNSISPKSSN